MRVMSPTRPRQVIHHEWIAEAHAEYREAKLDRDQAAEVFWWAEYTRRRTAIADYLRRLGLVGASEHRQRAALEKFSFASRKWTRSA